VLSADAAAIISEVSQTQDGPIRVKLHSKLEALDMLDHFPERAISMALRRSSD
jgi:hypothetical protein